MYRRVLVSVDGSQGSATALTVAERLADIWDAELEVLTVIVAGDDAIDARRAIERETWRIRHRHRTTLRPLHHWPSEPGDAIANEIADAVSEQQETLIVMATNSRSRMAGVVGSTAEQVSATVDGPVVLVGPNVKLADEWPSGDLVAAIDNTGPCADIVSIALDWADSLDLRSRVVSVLPNPTRLATQRARPITSEAITGSDPAKTIARITHAESIALVAATTHGRRGIDRLLRGSVAIDIARRSGCPVMLLHRTEAQQTEQRPNEHSSFATLEQVVAR